jgi:hypothetical protein
MQIYDYSWAVLIYILMDATIQNRLQKHAWPTPGPSKSMILAETMLKLSWTILFEIVRECTQDTLQDDENLWL